MTTPNKVIDDKKAKYVRWFHELIIASGLQPFFELSLPGLSNLILHQDIRKSVSYSYDKEVLHLTVTYIAPISLSKVDFAPLKEQRMKRISTWANNNSLNRIYVDPDQYTILNFTCLPSLSRMIDPEKDLPKFAVTNGMHRFAYATEKNIPTVMSLVGDMYIIRENWIRKILPKLELLRDKDKTSEDSILAIKY